MIRIGLRADFEFVPDAAALGFDYLELPLNRIAALSEDEFGELVSYLAALKLPVEAVCDMLPDDIRVTGSDVSAAAQHEYLTRAFNRARRLGVRVAAFDAPVCRAVPDGFDFMQARRQVGNFLRIVQGHAAQCGLRVAVKNYRRAECNLINTVSEAALISALLQLDHVGVLADTVQMAFSSESLDAVERAGGALFHVHTGCALKRVLPAERDGEDYAKLFERLLAVGYDGCVSAVCRGEYTVEAASAALSCLRNALDTALRAHDHL